ncbi:MAG: type I DNA topoisomerase [Acidimicrobiia bacterium]
MSKSLVIVESPAKARTIAGLLGRDFVVESSVGHIRDLPRNASEIPAKLKQEPWARLGVNVDEEFEPLYVVPKEKRDQVRKLKHVLTDASELYLATDEDREGESIAWHLTEVLQPKVPIKRLVFHEITPQAIRDAISDPRELDMHLVDAQEARRILDRLYGYEVSPVLWKKIRPKLSAGRVQSVAVRLIVERERERIRFHSASYWDIAATFSKEESTFEATVASVDDVRVATGRDFGPDAKAGEGVLVLDERTATELAAELRDSDFYVESVERKPYRRSPYPPFRTSTLQQEAARKLRFTAGRTMAAAQRLYEGGFITYMRTDSTALAERAVAEARRIIAERYGAESLTEKPRTYSRQVRNAQEVHEAIRPAGETFSDPEDVAGQVGSDEARVYELVWKRTIASQMADARGESVQVRLATRSGRQVSFATKGRTISFLGFLSVYVVDRDDPRADRDDQERPLPALENGDAVTVRDLKAQSHATKPPARYTEASLVRNLEKLGIGRPSTYASIISTIQDRGYVWKRASALIPTYLAFATVALLEGHFPDLVDYTFTARMEDDLDQIAKGETASVPWLSGFYFGNGDGGLRDMVADRLAEIDARQVNSILIGTDSHERKVVARVGRFGPYLQRGDDTASIPERLAPDELTLVVATELLDAPSGDKILGTDPDTGLTILARSGRFGPYVQLGGAEEIEDGTKPKTVSVPDGMELDEVGLEAALELLSLPRVVGIHPNKNSEITANLGRYGPYLKMGSESRSLTETAQVFTVTLDEAVDLFSRPPPPRRRGRAADLREIGEHPSTGKRIVLREGRYGPYVTDGELNASLRKGDDPLSVDLERAVELLEARKARDKKKK